MKKRNKIHILSEIVDRTKRNRPIKLDEYMNDPDKFEIVRGNVIVEKTKVKAAQANFRKNYDKVREFYE